MAKKPELDPNALLCNTCNRVVVPSKLAKNKGELVHQNEKIKDHDVTKTVSFTELSARLKKARTIGSPEDSTPVLPKKLKNGAKKAPVGKPRKSIPGPKPKEAKEIKPKSLTQRNRRVAQKVAGPEAVQKARQERVAATEARRAEAEATLPDMYYHPTKGMHYPKATSETPVINTKTKDIVVPKTGAIVGKFSGVIPTDTSKPSEVAGEEHLASHPEHAWETAVDPRSIEKTGTATPLIGPIPEQGSSNIRTNFTGMLSWAHDHKRQFDKANRYEYTLIRPTLPVPSEKNPVFTRHDAENFQNAWVVKRRLKFCADCAPTTLDPARNKLVKNRAQTVTRPEPQELPAKPQNENVYTGNEDTKNSQTVLNTRKELGLITDKARPGPKTSTTVWDDSRRTGSFQQGSGDGKPAGAE